MKNFKILAEFIKDVSSETKDIQTYLFVKDYISKYQLTIDINSQPTKNKLIEINTTLKFEDKEDNKKKSYFELVYVSIVKLDESVTEKKKVENQKPIRSIRQLHSGKDLKMSSKRKTIMNFIKHFLMIMKTPFYICIQVLRGH